MEPYTDFYSDSLPRIAFAAEHRLIQVDQLFEDLRAVSELSEIPTNYVFVCRAERSIPAKVVIGRPVAKVWTAWGEFTQRGDGPQTRPLTHLMPIRLFTDRIWWQGAAADGRPVAFMAETEGEKIPMPAGLEGWQERGNPRNPYINWIDEESD